jgi:hypothetical protein
MLDILGPIVRYMAQAYCKAQTYKPVLTEQVT